MRRESRSIHGIKIIPVLTAQWVGRAGEIFRNTIASIASYSDAHIHPQEKLNEAPDPAWNRLKGEANEKHSASLVNFAEEENKRIKNELDKGTFDHQIRASKANADKLEAEARIARTNDLMALLSLLEKLQQLGVLPISNSTGNITVRSVPEGFDWAGLQRNLLVNVMTKDVELSTTQESSLSGSSHNQNYKE